MRWRGHEKIILSIVLRSQNLDWQKKIVCRAGPRFCPTSTTTPRFFTRKGMARRPGNSSAPMGCMNTSVKEIFTRKFLCRTWRTIGAPRRPWLWPRHVPRLRLAVLVFPDFNENFSVVDDLQTPEPLPAFPEVQTAAARKNPDLRAATSALQ